MDTPKPLSYMKERGGKGGFGELLSVVLIVPSAVRQRQFLGWPPGAGRVSFSLSPCTLHYREPEDRAVRF